MDSSVKSLTNRMETLNAKIELEKRKLEADTQAAREEFEARLASFAARINDTETALASHAAANKQHGKASDEAKVAVDAGVAERDRLRLDTEQLREEIQRIDRNASDALNVYGAGVRSALQEIQTSNWSGGSPVGPLGYFVELKPEARAYGNCLRVMLASSLHSFAVTNHQDRIQLKQILMRHARDPADRERGIIVADTDLFDYQSGEPRPEVFTVLRALNVYTPSRHLCCSRWLRSGTNGSSVSSSTPTR